MAKARNCRIISVNENFDLALRNVLNNARKKRKRKVSYNDITAELSRMGVDRVFNKMMFG